MIIKLGNVLMGFRDGISVMSLLRAHPKFEIQLQIFDRNQDFLLLLLFLFALGMLSRFLFRQPSSVHIRYKVYILEGVFFKEYWTPKPLVVNTNINLGTTDSQRIDRARKIRICHYPINLQGTFFTFSEVSNLYLVIQGSWDFKATL